MGDWFFSAPVLFTASLIALSGGAALASGEGGDVGVTNAAPPGGLLEALLFYGVAGATTLCALGVCFTQNIVRMAVWLFVALSTVAMLYFSLAANFLGAIQLIVYAGGTLVLLVFGVMLTSKSPWVRFDSPLIERIGAGVVCALLAICIAVVLTRSTFQGAVGVVPGAAVEAIGRRLITVYLVPFEVAGVLLMIVMVGAAHLARQEKQ
jgi:NADH-quinone oxidoreductase subunit J